VKKWMVLAAALLVAGCTTSKKAPEQKTSGFTQISSAGAATQRARTFTELAAAYYDRAQYKIALDELRKAIAAESDYGPAYNVYGLVYMELGEDKLADDSFRRAIDLNRLDSNARTNYGWFLCTRGQYEAGQAQFTEALNNPLYAQPERAMINAGLCAEKKGDMSQAEQYMLKALKLQPDNPATILSLADLNFRQGRLMDARRLLDRHDELTQPSAASLWLGVRLERKLGDRAQEAAYGLQLRKRFPDSNEAQLLQAGKYE
jgi:type IV pilus assembly protein PilF